VHDLRHSYASILASAGLSLPVIGALLGHTQPGTTARYAHLFDDPLRAATERVGAIVSGNGADKPAAEVIELKRAQGLTHADHAGQDLLCRLQSGGRARERSAGAG
jgi:hypothetical protein